MDTSLYIRIRGRVLGPYDQDKLQGLARRGQLSRMHELSTDGVTWARASNFPELFTSSSSNELPDLNSAARQTVPAGASFGQDQQRGGYRSVPPTGSPQPVPGTSQTKWYYTSSGQQQGPVDFSDLQMLFGLGQLGAEDQVWSDGMAAWTPASQIQGLMKPGGGQETGHAVSNDISSSTLTDSLCRSARDSRAWAIFISVIMYLFSISNIVFGILVLIVGARERSATGVADGVIMLVHALIIVIGGTMLSTYASRLGTLRYSKEPLVLERALDALRNFWIFAGMYLVVLLAFVVIAAIAVFAYGVTLPHV